MPERETSFYEDFFPYCMSCKEKNIDRSGYVLCPQCKEGKFTFQDMPRNRIYFDSCPVCHQMMSVGFDEYMAFVKPMGEGIPVPESKKCEEKRCGTCKMIKCYCVSKTTGIPCDCPCHLPLTETHTIEPVAKCEGCGGKYPCVDCAIEFVKELNKSPVEEPKPSRWREFWSGVKAHIDAGISEMLEQDERKMRKQDEEDCKKYASEEPKPECKYKGMCACKICKPLLHKPFVDSCCASCSETNKF